MRLVFGMAWAERSQDEFYSIKSFLVFFFICSNNWGNKKRITLIFGCFLFFHGGESGSQLAEIQALFFVNPVFLYK